MQGHITSSRRNAWLLRSARTHKDVLPVHCRAAGSNPTATGRRGRNTPLKVRKMCGTGSGPPESRTETEDDWTTPPTEWDWHAVPILGMAPHGACPCRPNAQQGQRMRSTTMTKATMLIKGKVNLKRGHVNLHQKHESGSNQS